MIECMNENDMQLFYSVLQFSKENKGAFTITIEGKMNWQLYEMIKPQISLEEVPNNLYANTLYNTLPLTAQRA